MQHGIHFKFRTHERNLVVFGKVMVDDPLGEEAPEEQDSLYDQQRSHSDCEEIPCASRLKSFSSHQHTSGFIVCSLLQLYSRIQIYHVCQVSLYSNIFLDFYVVSYF